MYMHNSTAKCYSLHQRFESSSNTIKVINIINILWPSMSFWNELQSSVRNYFSSEYILSKEILSKFNNVHPHHFHWFLCFLIFQGDEHDEKAKVAYQALMKFGLYRPTTPEYETFQHEVERRQNEEYNWTRPPGDDVG